MFNNMPTIRDALSYFYKSRHWTYIVLFLFGVTGLAILYIYKADVNSETNLVNTITIITTALALFLLFSDFHRNWKETREKRLTALFYYKNDKNKPAVMFYYRASLGGESDIRGLTQQLGVEIIQRAIGENKKLVNTKLNLNAASNRYIQMPRVLQEESGQIVSDFISVAALHDWDKEILSINNKNDDEKIEQHRESVNIKLMRVLSDKQIIFANGNKPETEWSFTTWEDISTQIDPEIKGVIENCGKDYKLLQFI